MDKKTLQIWRGLNTEESVGAGGFIERSEIS